MPENSERDAAQKVFAVFHKSIFVIAWLGYVAQRAQQFIHALGIFLCLSGSHALGFLNDVPLPRRFSDRGAKPL
jgi:hypothetical protein